MDSHTQTPDNFLNDTPARKMCRECGAPFAVTLFAAWIHTCEPCRIRLDAEETTRATEESERLRRAKWEELCPPDFRHTDPRKLPRPELLNRVLEWQYGPRGLILHGPTGLGKSRCAWQLMRREFNAGRRIRAVDYSVGYEYGAAFAKSAADAAVWVERLCKAEILLFDDVFKSKLTDSLEQAIFAIISSRHEHRLPIIITTNDTSKSLTSRLSQDRGDALMRRLVESTRVVVFN